MCDLCKLEQKSKWYYQDSDIVVCDCIVCKIPQVIWRTHSMNPPPHIEMKMITKLNQIAQQFYGHDNFYIDTVQRKIPDHLHYHARLNR